MHEVIFVPILCSFPDEEEEEVGIICESEESPRQIVPSKSSRIAAEYSISSRSVNSKCETGEPQENVRENNESRWRWWARKKEAHTIIKVLSFPNGSDHASKSAPFDSCFIGTHWYMYKTPHRVSGTQNHKKPLFLFFFFLLPYTQGRLY